MQLDVWLQCVNDANGYLLFYRRNSAFCKILAECVQNVQIRLN